MQKAEDMFEIGDRAEWTYRHWLNRKSSTLISKRGTILRFFNKGNTKMVIIQFDNNKYPSRVPIDELGF